MPLLWPEHPSFANHTEKVVWEALRDQLGPNDLLIANLRLTNHERDYEIDCAVVFDGGGVVVVEVKGGSISRDGGQWFQKDSEDAHQINPVEQAMSAKHTLKEWVYSSPQWGSLPKIRWGHAVCFPHMSFPAQFSTPDCPRWMVIDREDLKDIASKLRNIVLTQDTSYGFVDGEGTYAIHDCLSGRFLPQADAITVSTEHEDVADQLTELQSVILNAIQLLPRVEVRGGAGSGKTWLAMEQATRLSHAGKRVALICYSRGLAAWMKRKVETLPRKDRPAYVGTFHGLGETWGAPQGSDDESAFWEERLPELMVELGPAQPEGKRFDAIIIDEAQDFADNWWSAVFAALKHDDDSLYVFTDEGQRVFSRYGGSPAGLVPLVLDQNLRNTKQISETFLTMAPHRMRASAFDGPDVRFVPCAAEEALDAADDLVDSLLDEGWRPSDIAILATGKRHPEQTARQEYGQDSYWDSFWDDEQVFYGHVLGFKGLERNVVILAINEPAGVDRAKERLYVGLSRARDLLIVCGDPQHIEDVGGPAVLRKLSAT